MRTAAIWIGHALVVGGAVLTLAVLAVASWRQWGHVFWLWSIERKALK